MKNKIRSYFPFLLSLIFLSGCYEYEISPLAETKLMLSETKVGQYVLKNSDKIVSAMRENTEGQGGDIDRFEDVQAYEISPDAVLVSKENDRGRWETSILMMNSGHVFICTLMGNKDFLISDEISFIESEEPMNPILVKGDKDKLQQFFLNSGEKGVKMCIAIPV